MDERCCQSGNHRHMSRVRLCRMCSPLCIPRPGARPAEPCYYTVRVHPGIAGAQPGYFLRTPKGSMRLTDDQLAFFPECEPPPVVPDASGASASSSSTLTMNQKMKVVEEKRQSFAQAEAEAPRFKPPPPGADLAPLPARLTGPKPSPPQPPPIRRQYD